VSSVDSLEIDAQANDDSDSDIDNKIKQFGKEQDNAESRSPMGRNGLFANSKLGPKVTETGKELSRKASNGSLDGDKPSTGYRPWGVKAKSTNAWLKRALSSPEKPDEKLAGDTNSGHPPITAPTPNKSFAWDADADFTAGDLLVSESPPVKTGTGNSSPPRYRNTKLDEIRALEIEAALKYPDEPPESGNDDESPERRRRADSGGTHSSPNLPLGRTNTKLDEIRAREIESLSRRAVAKTRLDEIRERNTEQRSRSSSPEIPRKSGKEVFRESPLEDDRALRSAAIIEGGEHIPNTPVTIFKKLSPEANKSSDVEGRKPQGNRDASQDVRRDPLSGEDSQDLLRRLARAASTSPAPEQQATKSDAKDAQDEVKEPEKESNSRFPKRERNAERAGDRPRTVGFAGLRREPSGDSLSDKSDKRSSLALSDNDPTERIEREMQLFAPMDNHSERGSIRAPSPQSDMEDDVEETPRPVRIDPLTLPTPKVTGAYIETPATVKVDRLDFSLPQIVEPAQEGTTSDSLPASRGRKVEISLRKPSQTSSAEGGREAARSKSVSRIDRRAKSLPRARSPLINSVRPPTVKDDLLEIQRTYQIEDSTLDDLDGFFAAQDKYQETTSPKPETETEVPIKIEVTETQAFLTDQKSSKTINRIGRSLESIRTARKGIERLEDEVSRAKVEPSGPPPKAPISAKSEPPDSHHHHLTHPEHTPSTCPICQAHSSDMVAYVHLPLPRLWRRKPTFRLTFLGIVLSLLSLWYVSESAVCALYCKPEYCYPGQPCDWSYDDPFWGHAIPVKLDQWTTGGRGRAVARRLRPEIEDWVADVWDAVTGTDIASVDTTGYDWEARRRYRRRMMKRGLAKPLVETPEDRARHAAWRAARIAVEEAEARREMGYDFEEEETMAADERVR
jgi:hypothetical protein